MASAPALLAVLVLVTDLARIWLARVELETAVEAGALAGARSWGAANDEYPETDQLNARNTAVLFTEANGVVGSYVPVTNNYGGSPTNNTNLFCTGNVIFGSVSRADLNGVAYQFQASVEVTSISHDDRGVTVVATAYVTSFWQTLFGLPLGPYKVTAQATAPVQELFRPAGVDSGVVLFLLDGSRNSDDASTVFNPQPARHSWN